jgi:hypothetical protein
MIIIIIRKINKYLKKKKKVTWKKKGKWKERERTLVL